MDRSIISMTDSDIKCIVCIYVSFLYSSLTFETLHYPWIPSCCLSCFVLQVFVTYYLDTDSLLAEHHFEKIKKGFRDSHCTTTFAFV